MDGPRFDELSKRLADPLARRIVLKGLGGGLVAGLLVRAGDGTVAAAPCRSHVRCGHGKTAACCLNATDTCGTSNICQSATLTCPAGGDASNPSYRCTDSGGFPCDCATEESTGNFICFNSGSGCTATPCSDSGVDCANGERCVEASSCASGTACVMPCS